MGTHMKTTLEVNDALLAEAKAMAARRGITLRALVEAALRRELDEVETRPKYRMKDRSKDLGGLRPEFAGATFQELLEESYRGRGT